MMRGSRDSLQMYLETLSNDTVKRAVFDTPRVLYEQLSRVAFNPQVKVVDVDDDDLKVYELTGTLGSEIVNVLRCGFTQDRRPGLDQLFRLTSVNRLKTATVDWLMPMDMVIFDDPDLAAFGEKLLMLTNIIHVNRYDLVAENLDDLRNVAGFDVRVATVDGLRFVTELHDSSDAFSRRMILLTDTDRDAEDIFNSADEARQLMFPEADLSGFSSALLNDRLSCPSSTRVNSRIEAYTHRLRRTVNELVDG